MAKQSLSAQISSVLRSYKNNARRISNVVGLALRFAQENDGNPVHIQKIMDGVDPQDAAMVAAIVRAVGAHNVTDGVVKVRKAKDRTYNEDMLNRLTGERAPSFRTIAGELGMKNETKSDFDLNKAALNFLKRVSKEGADMQAVSDALKAAAKEMESKSKETA